MRLGEKPPAPVARPILRQLGESSCKELPPTIPRSCLLKRALYTRTTPPVQNITTNTNDTASTTAYRMEVHGLLRPSEEPPNGEPPSVSGAAQATVAGSGATVSSAGLAQMDIVENTVAVGANTATTAAGGGDVPRSIGESAMSVDNSSSAPMAQAAQEAAAPMDQEPEEAEGTVSLVAGRAKRKRKSTVMTVDGQAVLKLNNCACTPSISLCPCDPCDVRAMPVLD